jgi:Ca-activated chloride channel family protein
MFRFEHPEFFWLMAVPAALILVYLIRIRLMKHTWKKWSSEASMLKTLAGNAARPQYLWMALSGFFLLALGAVNPQWGYKTINEEHKSADLYIALDISNSMLAEDIAPNRLERARRLALAIAYEFRADRVGLILFAGNAYIQSPLTTDWHAIQLYLNAANPDQAGTQGTEIGNAIRHVIQSGEGDKTNQSGAIIVLTDGEDHDEGAPSAVQNATTLGWTTYIIGVGTAQGGTIPVEINGNRELKRDEHGQVVTTKLNEPLMRELASKGNGRYFSIADEGTIVSDLKKELATLSRTQLEKRSFSEHRSYYQWFVLPGLLLILGCVAINYRYDVV